MNPQTSLMRGDMLPVHPRFEQLLLPPPADIRPGYVVNINPALEEMFVVLSHCPKITLVFEINSSEIEVQIPGIQAASSEFDILSAMGEQFSMDLPNLTEIFRSKCSQSGNSMNVQWVIKSRWKDFNNKRDILSAYWDVIEEVKIPIPEFSFSIEFGIFVLKRKPISGPVMTANPLRFDYSLAQDSLREFF
jgi:hypothetical protein